MPHEQITPRQAPQPTPRTPADTGWFADYSEVVTFGGVLVHADALEDGQMAVIEYFQSPWSYEPEYIKWTECGRPHPEPDGDFGWQQFLDYIEAR